MSFARIRRDACRRAGSGQAIELAGVTQRSQRESDRPILFKKVRDELSVVTNLFGSRRRLGELIGQGMGLCRRWTELMRPNLPVADATPSPVGRG
ncbi:MAG: UbiD family decarboxylase [Anaerolineae bacterium]